MEQEYPEVIQIGRWHKEIQNIKEHLLGNKKGDSEKLKIISEAGQNCRY